MALFALVTGLLFWAWQPLGWAGVVLTLWCVYFFRDPPRVTPIRPGLVISPADGLIVSIAQVPPPLELEMGSAPMTRIGVFLNVFDVHINRIPMAGTVERTHYHKGKFVNASLDKASDVNERMAVGIRTALGPEIAVVQIAGLVARRILCHIVAGQAVETGERFGLIRFGSRTDLYIPLDWSVQVIEGQRVLGAETVLADASSAEPARQGAIR